MKQITTLFILLFFYGIAIAQTYTGKVTTVSNEPLAYANVVAKTTENNQFIKGELTTENGEFALQLDTEQSFYLEIGFVGYETKIIEPTTEELGTITLQPDTTIEEVVVVAQRQAIEQQADRLVFNVEQSATVAGGDAIDALKITPGVNVSDDAIAILGKGSVQVMINDRLVQMKGEELVAYLGSISADDIQKIEVITTPPAKYDAEGNSGLINIQVKQPKEGSWNNNTRASYIQTSYPAVAYGNTFTYNNGKLSATASINGKQGHEGQLLTTNVAYDNGPWLGEIKFKNDESYTNTRLGIDYNLTDKTSVGGVYAGNFRDNIDTDVAVNDIFNTSKQKIGSVLSNGSNQSDKTYHSANLHATQRLDTLGREISFDADYFYFDQPQNRTFQSEQFNYNPSLIQANNISNQIIQNKSIKLDVTHPTENIQLSYGAKYSTTNSNNAVEFYNLTSSTPVLDVNQSNVFEYTENVTAIYADASKTFGKKIQAKLGLRGEHTTTEGVSKTLNQTNKNDYNKLFPTAFVAYQLNEKQSINASYSKRIQRPGFWALNPFRWYINQNSYAEGNPFLQPQISNNIEVQHVYKGMFISKVFLSTANQGYGELSTVNSANNQLVVRRENYFNNQNYGLQQTIVANPVKRWNTTTQFSVYQNAIDIVNGFSEIELEQGTSFQFYSNNTFAISDKNNIKAEVTGMYASPQYVQMFKTDNFYGVDLGLSAQFLENKLTVKASMNDIFKTSAPTVTARSNGVNQVFSNYNDNRYGKINISYSFGNQNIRAKKRSFGNSDEQNRANQ